MNIGDITSNILIYIGLIGLAFALLVKVLTSFYRQYMVHYRYENGSPSYYIVKAFSKYGASKKAPKFFGSEVRIVTKVVRYREERL